MYIWKLTLSRVKTFKNGALSYFSDNISLARFQCVLVPLSPKTHWLIFLGPRMKKYPESSHRRRLLKLTAGPEGIKTEFESYLIGRCQSLIVPNGTIFWEAVAKGLTPGFHRSVVHTVYSYTNFCVNSWYFLFVSVSVLFFLSSVYVWI